MIKRLSCFFREIASQVRSPYFKHCLVAEILKASLEQCSQLIAYLINVIVQEGKIPKEWGSSYIISLFKGKDSALERGNYCGLYIAYISGVESCREN